jgi:hypothetical protein
MWMGDNRNIYNKTEEMNIKTWNWDGKEMENECM